MHTAASPTAAQSLNPAYFIRGSFGVPQLMTETLRTKQKHEALL
jgi:hypothetical protein